ncbi:MAG: ABC transporter substrate-binding protein [Candidatus Goldbacteria bacterium]|nr:ABC transporter substrate-binding protein [Candidatus Goldiibacteriota bacterium]
MKKISVLIICLLAAPFLIFSMSITDDVGRTVEVKGPVNKIVCISPAHTEMIYYLGLENRLAAVSMNCDYPAQAKLLPKAGDFMNPDEEQIIRLSPQAVISGGGVQKSAIYKLESMGVPVIVLYPRELADIASDMRKLNALLGGGRKAEKKIIMFEKRLNKAVSKKRDKIKVYAEIWGEPLMAVSENSFTGKLISAAGGSNVVAFADGEYPKVSKEEIIKANPEKILLFYNPEKNFLKRPCFSATIAGKNNGITAVTGEMLDRTMRPGPRVVEAIEELKRILQEGAIK